MWVPQAQSEPGSTPAQGLNLVHAVPVTEAMTAAHDRDARRTRGYHAGAGKLRQARAAEAAP